MGSNGETVITNLVPSLDALLVAHAFAEESRPFLLIVEEASEAERLYDDLARLVDEEHLALFSEGAHASILKRERQKRTQTAEATAQLLEAIERLAHSTNPLITIADAESLGTRLPLKKDFAGESLLITVGSEAGFAPLIHWLEAHHFDRKQFVESAGDFAVRGGIIDVFPFTETLPIRIEFFGDSIESMREFDAISQRSIAGRGELVLVPNILTESEANAEATIFDYLVPETVAVTFEPERISAKMEESGVPVEILHSVQNFTRFSVEAFPAPSANVIDFGSRTQPSFNANLKLIRKDIQKLSQDGYQTILMSETKDLTKRLRDLMEDEVAGTEGDENSRDATLRFIEPSLAFGFQIPNEKYAIYTEHELFGRRRERGASARKSGADERNFFAGTSRAETR